MSTKKKRLTAEELKALAEKHGKNTRLMADDAGISIWMMYKLMKAHGLSCGSGKYPRPPMEEGYRRALQKVVAGQMRAAEAAAELKITTQAVYAAKKKFKASTSTEGKDT